MDLKEQKQKEEQLRQSEQYAWGIVNSSIEGIISTDSDQLITHFNPAAEKMFGYAASQVLGKSLDILIPSSSRAVHKPHVQNFAKSNVTRRAMHGALDVMALHANGKEFPVEVSISQFEVDGKKAFTASVRDITMRKQAEDQVRFQAHILKSIDQAVIVTTPAGIVTYVNQFAETMYGWAATDALGKDIIELTVPQISSAQAQEIMASLRDGRNWQGEFMAQRQDGSVIMVQVVNTPIMDQHGNITAIAGISSDISKRKQIEDNLVQMSRALRESQQIAHLGSFEYVVATQATNWSEEEYRIFGLDPSGPSPEYSVMLDKCIHPDDAKLVDHTFMAAVKTQTNYALENRIVRPDGSIRWIYNKANPYFDEHGNLLRFVGITLDITDRKQSELVLQESEKKFRELFENLIDEVHLWKIVKDKTGKITGWQLVDANPSALKAWGKPINEIIGKTANEIFGADAHGQFMPIVEEIFKTNKPYHWENYFAPTDQYLYMESIPFGDYFISTGKDITESKKAEIKIQESEAMFKNSFEASPIPFALNDSDGNISNLNAAFIQTFGYNLSDIPTLNDWWPLAYPDINYRHWVASEWKKRLDNMLQNNSVFEPMEIDIRCKDGSTKVVLASAAFLEKSSQGLHQVILVDITERKHAEKIIEKSEADLKEAQSMAKLGRWELNLITSQLHWSDSVYEIFEIDKKQFEATYEAFLNVIHIDDRQLVNDAYARSLEVKQPYEVEHRLQMADGRIKWVKESCKNDFDENGKALKSVGIVQDISEQKQAEIELKSTQQKLESIFGEMDDVVWSMAYPSMETLFVTPSVEQLYGYPIQEWMEQGSTLYQQIIHPEDRGLISQMFERLEKNRKVEQSYRVITAGGITKWVNSKIRVIKDQNGTPFRLDGQVQDITERKRIEEKFKRNNQLLEASQAITKVGGWELDLTNNQLFWTAETYRIHDTRPEEFNPTVDAGVGYFLPESKKQISEALELAMTKGIGYDLYLETYTTKGRKIEVRTTCEVTLVDGKPTKLTGIFQDITEHKKTQNELETSNTRLSIAKEAAKIGIWEFFFEDQKLIWDDKMFDLFNVSKSTFSGTYEAWRSTVHPDDLERSEQELQKAIASGQSFSSEFRIVWQDKSIHHIKGMAESVRDENGKPYKMIGVNYDITKQKEAQNEIERSNARLSIATQSAHIGIWEFLIEEDILIWEDETLKLFGLTRDSFSGNYEGWKSTVHPEDIDEAEQKIREAIANKTILNMEFRTIWPDKTIRHIGAFGKPILDNTGKVIKLVGTNYDVTERVQNEIELIQAKEKAEESEKKLLEAQELSHVGSWEYITETDTVTWSNELFNIFERSPNLGAPRYSEQRPFYTDESFTRLDKAVLDCVEREIPYEILLNIIAASGSIKQIISKGQIKKDLEGKIIGCVGTAQDVTKQKKLEAELIAAKEKAEESDRLKTAFLANMSHEIRTPMNGIMGFANLLQKQGITHQKETEYLALIQQSGTRMLNIINDIISISKIELGEISVTLSPTNINEKLEFIRSFFEPEASTKGIQIIVTGALPANKTVVITDPEKVYGTLTNLVKNAIKFTHAGTIELGCREKPEQAELEFFVKDKGIGIAHDQLDFIFERFRQVNESSTRSYEGAGLGLAISKAQVEKLGGKIWVESEVGKGSTFYFTIPCQRDLPGTQVQAAELGSSKNKEQSHKGIKIVLAEDDYISAAFLKAVLNINGNEILHATTGTEAVEFVRNNPDTDVVLMDLSMPELNGYEATSQIRQFNKTAVIIVQSGYTFDENRKQATEAGCTDFISKPVDENELLRMIAKYVRK